jgi:sporulation protein YlmC with PRC-barrel domain
MFQPKKTKITMCIAVTVLLITTVTLVYAASSDVDRTTSPAQRSQDSYQSDQYSQAGTHTGSMQLCSADKLIGSDVKSKSAMPSMDSSQHGRMTRDSDQATNLSNESQSQRDMSGENQSTPRPNSYSSTDSETGRMTQRDADSTIGTVEELIIDDSHDQVCYVILNSDDKFYPVPWKAFEVKTGAVAGTRMQQSTSERRSTTAGQTATDPGTYPTTPGTTTAPGLSTPGTTGEREASADPVLYLSMSKQQLQQAPTISSVSIQRLSDTQLKQRIDTFYSQYTGKSSRSMMDSSQRVGARSSSSGRDSLTGQAQQDIARAGETVRDTASDTAREIEQAGQTAQDTIAGRTARDTEDAPGQTDDMDTTAQAGAGQMNLFKASEVMGLDVQSTADDDLGSIKDLVIDSREGHIAYSLISFGGFLNIGGKIAAVPWSSVTIQMQQNIARLDATEDKLNAVVIEEGNISQLSQQQFAQKIHDNFNVEPYWGVYGFIPGQTGAGAMSAWQANSTYNQRFDPSKVITIEGTIERVSSFEPESGAAPGVQLNVKTDDGKTMIVHTGPKQHIDQQELKFDQGKKVKITGSKVQLDGQTVILATKVTADDKSVDLRDVQGKPRWSDQQDMVQPTDRSEPGRQSGRESTPNQNQSNY